MNRGRSVIVLAVVASVGMGVVWLLATGGSSASSSDPREDVEVSKGAKPPQDTTMADLLDAGAQTGDTEVVLEATVDAPIPESFDQGGLTFRWEISEEENVTWIVTASVDIEQTASVVATRFEYSSTTIDGSLPGRLEVDGDTVRVTLEPNEIRRFPDSFSWSVSTTLDGDRGRPTSATAVDMVPDEGSLRSAS